MPNPLRLYEERFQPFSDAEAWLLFRIAAFGEAVGWTLLITGIVMERVFLDGAHWPVAVAGRIHGTLFIVYMVAAVVLYPSLRWRRWQAVVAVAASVPPFGSLLFEELASWFRHYKSSQQFLYQQLYIFFVS